MTQPQIDINERFPDLSPINSAPTMFTLNGFGTRLYGKRDEDFDTGTHVATLFITALFVPLFGLTSYRVAKTAGSQWAFLGKQPLSTVVKLWNVLVLSGLLVGGIALWQTKLSNSPETQAKRKLAAAEKQLSEGNTEDAARSLQEVALGNTSKSASALARLEEILADPGPLTLSDQHPFYAIICNLHQVGRWRQPVAQLIECGVQVAEEGLQTDPNGAVAILKTLETVASDGNDKVRNVRRQALQAQVIRRPDDLELVGDLAVMEYQEGNLERCVELLEKHAHRLGDSEGAWVMGMIYSARDELESAHQQFANYTKDRLPTYLSAERRATELYESAYAAVIDDLNAGTAPGSFYREYDAATPERQDQMVYDYVNDQLKEHASVNAAREELIQLADVVPIALEHAIVNLRRAQSLEQPDARQSAFEECEQMFLALNQSVGDNDEYRIYFGQIKYWLGKPEEGHALFDAVIENSGRDPQVLSVVAGMLRSVGAWQEAREMIEEAYTSAQDDQTRYQAAYTRALLQTDLEDRIEWLRKADPNSLSVTGNLLEAEGEQAYRNGDTTRAIELLTEAGQQAEQLAENATTLNDVALIHFRLHSLTGDPQHANKAIGLIERAVALSPTDSILQFNAATAVEEAGWREILSPQLEMSRLNVTGNRDLLDYLYNDAETRDQLLTQIRSSALLKKALSYYRKVQLLAPQLTDSYDMEIRLYEMFNDVARSRQLHQRVMEADFDLEDDQRQRREYIDGKDLDRLVRQVEEEINRRREVLRSYAEDPKDQSFAVATDRMVQSKLTLGVLGQPLNHDFLLNVAKLAHRNSPSSGTRTLLLGVLCSAANEQLTRRDPDYERVLRRCQRSLGPLYCLTVKLGSDESTQAWARENEHLKQAFELTAEQVKRVPSWLTPWCWQLAVVFDPQLAERWQEQLAADECGLLSQEMRFKMAPDAGATAYTMYLWYRVLGDRDRAAQVMAECRALGTPLPEDKQFSFDTF